MTDIKTSGATAKNEALNDLQPVFEEHRSELVRYCYRMLGSAFEAEDAVQETMVRAWRGFDRFEGRAAVRSWLYRIATNVCIDMLRGRQRRARPMDLGPAVTGASEPGPTQRAEAWIEPIPGGWLGLADDDPADLVVSRESIRLAFVAALQHLPPRQRAVLILREVLNWKASEVADLLGGTVASVNSALQRARSTLAATDLSESEPAGSLDPENGELLARYVDAFQRYDMESLTALIHEDATQSMPPYAMWLEGREDIFAWWIGPGAACRGSRLIPTIANGAPAFAQYKRAASGDGYDPWAIQVLEVSGGRIVDFTFFLDTARLFPLFGLPLHLDS
jgi:RNA polymerase sigma-70 factor (ECF subfamily)